MITEDSNIEGIGMDREEKPKRKRVNTATPMTSSPKPKAPDKDTKIIELYDDGFNINQIGAMLTVHTQYVKDLIKRENEKL